MKFKNELAEREYLIAPKKLKEVCEAFETYSLFYGITPIVTRVRETVIGSSRVHEVGRAVDFRDQYALPDGKMGRLYTRDQVETICRLMNDKFPRHDKKPTVLHHSFNGGVFHFHCQIEASALEPGEPLAKASAGQA